MKIKVAMLAKSLTVNGISSVIKNYCEHIDLQKFDMTILAGVPVEDRYREVYKKSGINLIELPNYKNHIIFYYIALYKTLKKGHYEILHVHENSVKSIVELYLAAIAKTRIRIMHSHNSICNHPIAHKILFPFFNMFCTDRFACGLKAGEWIFGNGKFQVLPNGFRTESYRFSQEKREKIRKELNLHDQLVIGHVGRINYQKNQLYLLDVFKKVALERDDVILLIVGTGPCCDEISELVLQHQFKDRIIMYGETDDASAIYSALDIFALPSRFEGLPVVLLEAQVSGLPCIVSDKVTREMDFGDIKWQSIDSEPETWADTILNMKIHSNGTRYDYYDERSDIIKKYDINENVKLLEYFYMRMYKREYEVKSRRGMD